MVIHFIWINVIFIYNFAQICEFYEVKLSPEKFVSLTNHVLLNGSVAKQQMYFNSITNDDECYYYGG